MKFIMKAVVLAMVLGLVAGCGGSGGGGGKSGTTDDDTPANLSPLANAGMGQTVSINSLVTLNGSQSSDPDENYPLTYAWFMLAQPPDSTAVLTADGPLASFVVDLAGDYKIQLIVTDQRGAESAPALVIISTINSAPVASAGPDQAFTTEGTTITLDGSESYDPDGDLITYQWTMTGKPETSLAELTGDTTVSPTFDVDFLGTYTLALVVTDAHGAESAVDTVIVTSENVAPVADAGLNQMVYIGETVVLDGSGSYDVDLDPLFYQWNISAKPEASTAELTDADLMYSTFVPDLQGLYTAVLVVSDGLAQSVPASVEVLAIDPEDEFSTSLIPIIEAVNDLEDDAFIKDDRKNALTSKILSVLYSYVSGTYDQEILDELRNGIGGKTDGCIIGSAPDQNDWIVDCDSQQIIYPLIQQAADYLEDILNSVPE